MDKSDKEELKAVVAYIYALVNKVESSDSLSKSPRIKKDMANLAIALRHFVDSVENDKAKQAETGEQSEQGQPAKLKPGQAYDEWGEVVQLSLAHKQTGITNK